MSVSAFSLFRCIRDAEFSSYVHPSGHYLSYTGLQHTPVNLTFRFTCELVVCRLDEGCSDCQIKRTENPW